MHALMWSSWYVKKETISVYKSLCYVLNNCDEAQWIQLKIYAGS